MTLFIGSHNVHRLSKVQSAASYGNRDNVVILWDDLSKKQRHIAANIDVDLEVQTSDPSSVPDKWSDSIVELESEIDHIDIVKNIIANPSRLDVYETLVEVDPPEPLMLWWIEHVFNDPQYAELLSDICHYGLFKVDSDYLWAVVAFGVEAGIGKFSWPENDDDLSSSEKEEIVEIAEELGIREKELRLGWDSVKKEASDWVGPDREAEELEEALSDTSGQSTLLDLP